MAATAFDLNLEALREGLATVPARADREVDREIDAEISTRRGKARVDVALKDYLKM